MAPSHTLLHEVSVHLQEQLRATAGFEEQWIDETLGRQLCRLHRLWAWGAAKILVVGVPSFNVGINEFASNIADALWDDDPNG